MVVLAAIAGRGSLNEGRREVRKWGLERRSGVWEGGWVCKLTVCPARVSMRCVNRGATLPILKILPKLR